ncbi:MAG: hypothetical protein NXH84_17005 [Rhodobacteraceae bacterium]|jgi:hypothetical protein|nr:hypothetical protein [Paracoccaceae bacterium]
MLPLPAWAGVCETLRPTWDGTPVSAWQEAIWLLGTPISLFLLLASALVIRFRRSWAALAVILAWSFLVSAFTFYDPTGGQRTAAAAEGCVGSPVLFIAVVGAICVGLLVYTGKAVDKA